MTDTLIRAFDMFSVVDNVVDNVVDIDMRYENSIVPYYRALCTNCWEQFYTRDDLFSHIRSYGMQHIPFVETVTVGGAPVAVTIRDEYPYEQFNCIPHENNCIEHGTDGMSIICSRCADRLIEAAVEYIEPIRFDDDTTFMRYTCKYCNRTEVSEKMIGDHLLDHHFELCDQLSTNVRMTGLTFGGAVFHQDYTACTNEPR
jgi:hypothetical protein